MSPVLYDWQLSSGYSCGLFRSEKKDVSEIQIWKFRNQSSNQSESKLYLIPKFPNLDFGYILLLRPKQTTTVTGTQVSVIEYRTQTQLNCGNSMCYKFIFILLDLPLQDEFGLLKNSKFKTCSIANMSNTSKLKHIVHLNHVNVLRCQ